MATAANILGLHPPVLFLVLVGLVAGSSSPWARQRHPRLWWAVSGYAVTWLRIVRTWRELTVSCGLAMTRPAALSSLWTAVGTGRAVPRTRIPLRVGVRPTRLGLVATVRLNAGQVPDDWSACTTAFAHAWRVHSVHVESRRRGWVRLIAVALDPLAAAAARPDLPQAAAPVGAAAVGAPSPSAVRPAVHPAVSAIGPAALLRAHVGMRDDGRPWLMDLHQVPHWLIVGATRSGKSTLVNALVSELAPRAVALVGIDLKRGVELSLYRPRLSALATTRGSAAELLDGLVEEATARMGLCVARGVRSVWALDGPDQPVPVVVIVDELAELFLGVSREERAESSAVTTSLLRLAQLGAGLGIHLVLAGQRVGSDLGAGVTQLRSQLAGRVCHRVADPETAEMCLAQRHPEALQAALSIRPEDAGVAIIADDQTAWMRVRSRLVTEQEARNAAERYADRTPALLTLGGGSGPWPTDGR